MVLSIYLLLFFVVVLFDCSTYIYNNNNNITTTQILFEFINLLFILTTHNHTFVFHFFSTLFNLY